ncbi:MAG: hypothetical protein PHN39_01480 [Candidatus Pacebacteria bacterium]|nr:hypothetical protein [Candidatus Paceibacterota bacterium]
MANILFIVYYLITWVFGLVFTYFYGRKTREWRWSEYFLVAISPLLATLVLVYFKGAMILLYFFLCGIIGSLGELFLGVFCKKILGQQLWFYTKLPLLGGHTSLLNFPFWAGGGMLFFLLAQLFN